MLAACGATAAAQTGPARPSDETLDRLERERRGASAKSDWEKANEDRDFKEGEVGLPAYPAADRLIEFPVSGASRFRFFVDPASLSVAAEGVVRYTLVARSPSGYDNVSYEGIRCSSGLYKIYAYGHAGRWSPAQGEWKEIEPRSVQRWHNELKSRYLCPNRLAVVSAEEGVDALRRGGHPAARNEGTGY